MTEQSPMQITGDHMWKITDCDDKEISILAGGFNVMGEYVMFVSAANVMLGAYWRPKKFVPILNVEGNA